MSRKTAALCAACAACALSACGSSGAPSSSTQAVKATTTQGAGVPQVTKPPKYLTPSASEPVRSGLVNVAYHNITIEPALLRVQVGSTVKWTNHDEVKHNVTSEGGPQKFASENLSLGGTYQVKLTRPGVIHYECTIHPATMNGTIEVVG